MQPEETPGPSTSKKDDPIITQIGDFGRYQLMFCGVIFLSKFGTGWHTLAHIFLAAPTKSECIEPENITDPCDDDCVEYKFDNSVFDSTIITEWKLICDDEPLASMSQSLVMTGIMFGSIIFGIISDRCGRKPAFLGCCYMQLVTGLIVCLSPWFWFYCVFRFLVGFATGGTMTVSFVLIMELIGPKWRELIAISYQLPFNIGHASLALFAYLIRNWPWYQFSITIFSIVFIIYIWLVPESARWLFVTGKVDKAIKILEKIAKFNKRGTVHAVRPEIIAAHEAFLARASVKKANVIDLFRTPYLCMKTIIMAFNWLVVCMIYYGVGQLMGRLGGNIFLNVGIAAALGIPGTLICILLTVFLGRRITLILSNMISATGLLILAAIDNMENVYQVICAGIGLFGASITFPNVYLYSGELFPTVVRSSGVGVCSFVGRFGSIIAPQITDLGKIERYITPLIFGLISVLAAIGTFFLHETRGLPLPETLADGETSGRKNLKKKK